MNKHLLPCSCGAKTEVDANLAGLQVICVCGKTLEVPTLRGLQALQLAADTEPAGRRRRQETAWGPSQGLLFLGGVILLVGIAAAGYFWSTRPPEQMLQLDTTQLDKLTDSLSLAETWSLWVQFRQGLNHEAHPAVAEMDKFKQQHYFKLYASMAVAGIGAAIMAMSALLASPKPRAGS